MAIKKKRDYRLASQLAHNYGWGAVFWTQALPADAEPAEVRYGLWLNIPVIRQLDALAVSLGHGAATNNDPLPREWFEAQFEDDKAVDEAMWKTNMARRDARVMS